MDTDGRIRSAVIKFRRTCSRLGPVPESLLANGQSARVLAASKPGGMLLNVEAPEFSFFIADGMDITSQLVSVVADPEIHAALKESLRNDIRISVHAQHPIDFLSDVRDHRFDLMTFAQLDPPCAKLAAESLAPGGLLAVFATPETTGAESEELVRALAACGMLVTTGIGPALTAVRGPEHPRPSRRRGRRQRAPMGA